MTIESNSGLASTLTIFWQVTVGSAQPVEAAASPAPTLALPDKPSIAVLPFTNMSDDPEQEYFADGVAEDLLTTLSKIPDLMVIARNSSFVFKGQAKDVRDIGRTLGVRDVLEGSVRRSGNRVRLTAQLIDCLDGSHRLARHTHVQARDALLNPLRMAGLPEK